jgi:hypothetical protein
MHSFLLQQMQSSSAEKCTAGNISNFELTAHLWGEDSQVLQVVV